MDESQAVRVQRLACEQHLVFLAGLKRGEVGKAELVASAIYLVGKNRAPEAGDMDPDLVRASGARLELHECESAEPLGDLVVADRLLGLGNVLVGDDHPHAVGGMVHDPLLDIVAVTVECSLGDHRVFLEDLPCFKEHGEVAVGVFLLGDEDGAGSVAVEPVDDAGSVVAIDAGKLGEVEAKGVDKRSRPVALGRMHDHVGRLVDHREELILVKDVERDFLGDRFGVRGRRGREPQLVAMADARARLAGPAIDHHPAILDELLGHRTRDVGH